MDEIRRQIDEIDRQMAALYEQRMMCTLQVAEYKFNHHGKIFDPDREKAVIENNVSRLDHVQFKKQYQAFLQFMMDQSKRLQTEYFEKMKKENH
ncbi:MAG: chorismate mutase [Eubacteriaceae bacterium]|jgi:monofunctional chorismate mutase|nr:chorismate mutase [Eubacteriaceae bacterium]MDD4508336.1 chorismate mutase [Eubacteriaceae bacterium]